jgi:hypothetical protein
MEESPKKAQLSKFYRTMYIIQCLLPDKFFKWLSIKDFMALMTACPPMTTLVTETYLRKMIEGDRVKVAIKAGRDPVEAIEKLTVFPVERTLTLNELCRLAGWLVHSTPTTSTLDRILAPRKEPSTRIVDGYRPFAIDPQHPRKTYVTACAFLKPSTATPFENAMVMAMNDDTIYVHALTEHCYKLILAYPMSRTVEKIVSSPKGSAMLLMNSLNRVTVALIKKDRIVMLSTSIKMTPRMTRSDCFIEETSILISQKKPISTGAHFVLYKIDREKETLQKSIFMPQPSPVVFFQRIMTLRHTPDGKNEFLFFGGDCNRNNHICCNLNVIEEPRLTDKPKKLAFHFPSSIVCNWGLSPDKKKLYVACITGSVFREKIMDTLIPLQKLDKVTCKTYFNNYLSRMVVYVFDFDEAAAAKEQKKQRFLRPIFCRQAFSMPARVDTLLSNMNTPWMYYRTVMEFQSEACSLIISDKYILLKPGHNCNIAFVIPLMWKENIPSIVIDIGAEYERITDATTDLTYIASFTKNGLRRGPLFLGKMCDCTAQFTIEEITKPRDIPPTPKIALIVKDMTHVSYIYFFSPQEYLLLHVGISAGIPTHFRQN